MARNHNTTASGNRFDDATIEAVWQKGTPEPAYAGFRKDTCSASMQRSKYGMTVQFGWEIDHIKPVAKGGRRTEQSAAASMGKQPAQGRRLAQLYVQGQELRRIMKYDEDTRRAIYAKTDGRCHICGKSVAFSNYNAHGERGAWEVDHSIPVAEGGTDHLNNLFPAHTSCNRGKQVTSSRAARRDHGKTRAPLSSVAIERAKLGNAVSGAFTAGMLGARIAGPAGFWAGAILGAVIAYEADPETG